jgi:hypothetical protein
MDVNGPLSLDITTAPSDPLITGMMALCNQPSPPGFKMEPGPGAAIMRAPIFKCQYCSWGSGRESLVSIHERTCKREQEQFKAQRGLSADEVKGIVVETMKPMFAEFAEQLKASLAPVPVTPKPEPKKKGRKPRNGASPLRS